MIKSKKGSYIIIGFFFLLGQYQLLYGENRGQDDNVFCVPREKARQGY